MKPPVRRTFEQFLADIREWETENAELAEGRLRCLRCHSFIMERTVWLSIHDGPFDDCSGSGQVLKVYLPACSGCEPASRLYGCLHLSARVG